jgi:DNA-binding LytR/AlgR family response regulator
MHAANDRLIASHRSAVAAKQKVRDLKREDSQRAEKEQERAG